MKLNKIFMLLAGGALLATAAACTDEVKPEESPAVTGEGVYLSEADASVDIAEDATSVDVPVYRTNTAGSYTAQIEATIVNEAGEDASDIFTLPATVTFADGEATAAYTIGVDFAKVEPLEIYSLTLKVANADATPYGLATYTYNVSYSPWTEWELYSESDPGVYQMAALWDHEYDTPVYTRNSLINPDLMQYAVLSPFSDFEFVLEIDLNKKDTFMKNNVECYYVTAGTIDTPIVNSNYGEAYSYTDVWTYCTVNQGLSAADAETVMANRGWERSYYNPVEGRFYLNMMLYIPSGFFGVSTETLQLPGDFRDYYFNLNYAGNFVNSYGEETAIVNVQPSEDVKSFTYDLRQGALSADEVASVVEQLMEDADAPVVEDQNANLQFTISEEGKYTLVVVGYNEANEKVCDAYLTFDYSTVQASSPWKTIGVAEYTDGFISGNYNGIGGETWEVEVQESTETPGLYRVPQPYFEWPQNVARDYVWSLEGRYYMEVNSEDPTLVYLPMAELGIMLSSQDGAITVYSLAADELAKGTAPAQIKMKGYAGTNKDGVITFKKKALLIAWANLDSWYYANANGDWCLDMSMVEAKAPAKKAVKPVKAVKNIFPIERSVSLQRAANVMKSNRKTATIVSSDDMLKLRQTMKAKQF